MSTVRGGGATASVRPARGNRRFKRLGLIVPSTNTVAEPDFYRGAPPEVSVHSVRVLLAGGHPKDELAMVENELPRAARDLATIHPDVVVFSCTTAGAVVGDTGEQELVATLMETTGARVVSTNDAVREALRMLRPSSVALVTPYLDGLTAAMRDSLQRAGIAVGPQVGLGISDPFEIASVDPDTLLEFVTERLAGKHFDAIFLSCTNLRGLEARDAFATQFGVPVITSNQAALDAALHLITHH